MKATLTQRIAQLLRFGRVPTVIRQRLETEAPLLYIVEGVAETATLKNFRAPGVRCGWRKMGFVGFVVITEKRIVVKAGYYHHIDLDIAPADTRFQQISFVTEGDVILIRFDASLKGTDYSGEVEIRLHVPIPEEMIAALEKVDIRVEPK